MSTDIDVAALLSEFMAITAADENTALQFLEVLYSSCFYIMAVFGIVAECNECFSSHAVGGSKRLFKRFFHLGPGILKNKIFMTSQGTRLSHRECFKLRVSFHS